jgi:mannosyltransferase OCH1-like enzyme
MEEYFKQSYDAQMKVHETKVSKWQNEWLENPAPVIIRSLQNFLDVSKDIDYRAEVIKDAHGKLFFSKTVYENKVAEWKLCYRAGKETVEAAPGQLRVSGWTN